MTGQPPEKLTIQLALLQNALYKLSEERHRGDEDGHRIDAISAQFG